MRTNVSQICLPFLLRVISVLFLSFQFSADQGLIAQELTLRQGELIVQYRTLENAENTFEESMNKRWSDAYCRPLIRNQSKIDLVQFDFENTNRLELLDWIKSQPEIYWAQENRLIQSRKTPDDPAFSLQWHFNNTGNANGTFGEDMDAEAAWDLTTGGKTVSGHEIVVCVIDDGAESHPDLVDNLWINSSEIPDNGIDDDNNGYVDDYHGWNVPRESDDIFEDGSHGTPVAGLVGAKGNNGMGVTGVNWDVKLMIVSFDLDRGGDEATAIMSYGYPLKQRQLFNESRGSQGALVVATNSSWGIDNVRAEDSPIWCDIYNSLGSEGIINVVATANNNTNVEINGDMPSTCSSSSIIAVTNLNRNGEKEPKAGYGNVSIDLGAYGEDVYTTVVGMGYSDRGGTSYAAPQVAGIVGLAYSLPCSRIDDLVSSDPQQAARLIKNAVVLGAKPSESLQGITTAEATANMKTTLDVLGSYCESCAIPLDLEVAAQGTFDPILTWNNVAENITTNIRYRENGASTWIERQQISSPFTLISLSACSRYELQFESSCQGQTTGYGYSIFFNTDGCCTLPIDFTATQTTTEVNYNWDPILAAMSYSVEYKMTEEIVWTSATTSTNSFTLPIESCQAWDARISVVCSSGQTNFSDPISVASECGTCTDADYCEYNRLPDNSFEWIDKVTFANKTNTSGKDDGAYGDYAGSFFFNIVPNETYTLRVEPAHQNNPFDEVIGIWIDYDQNGTFNTDEQIFLSSEASPEPIETEIEIPNNVTLGTTRMRIAMAFSAEPDACGEAGFDFGEIEDYCVNILEEGSICDVHVIPELINATEDSLSLTWPGNELGIGYTIRYRESGNEEWIEQVTSMNSTALFNLSSCTEYEVQIQNICNDDISSFSGSYMFTTSCGTPTQDIKLETSLSYGPNPMKDYLDLNIPNISDFTELNYSILDGNARVMQSGRIKESKTRLSISQSYYPGIYLLHITSQRGSVVKKLIAL